jgi:hypothetical protein
MPPVDPAAALEPAGEVADGPGTFNRSKAQPTAVATPPADVLEIEQGVSARPIPPGLACVAPAVIETEGTAMLGAGPA